MTFTTSIKDEMSKNEINNIEARSELSGFIYAVGRVEKEISIILENASVARRIYKEIKMLFNYSCVVTIRNQKRFRVKQIYILNINDNVDYIIKSLGLDNKIVLDTDEERISFLQGAFLAVGNVSNPQTSGYHLEYICNTLEKAEMIQSLLNHFHFNAKIIDRGYKSIVYMKSSESISDLLKMFKATSAMFFFEDVRIYRDHKNMVNRLNNCELSNQIKTIATGQKQIKDIEYIKHHDLINLLDDKALIVIDARIKYPEASLSELAEIITLEYNYKIGKSGVNHHFIKIANMVKNHQNNNEE